LRVTYGPQPQPPIPDHLPLAITATVRSCLCLIPVGIPAIFYATRSRSKASAGDISGALHAAAKAKRWSIVSIAYSLLTALSVLVLEVLFITFGAADRG